MASDRAFRFGPVALSSTLTTNILNPNITSVAGPVGSAMPQPYIILRRIRIVTKPSSAATFSLYLGATEANAAGTEVVGTGLSVAENSAYDWYGYLRIAAAHFLVGGAGRA